MLQLRLTDGINNYDFKELESMKRIVSLALVVALILAFSTTAYAGGHGRRGGHHNNRQTAAWHDGTDHWRGHWAFECEEFCLDRNPNNNRHDNRQHGQRNINGFSQRCAR